MNRSYPCPSCGAASFHEGVICEGGGLLPPNHYCCPNLACRIVFEVDEQGEKHVKRNDSKAHIHG